MYERYNEAVEKLEMLLNMEREDSNIKIDAEKKLFLLYSFTGRLNKALTSSRKEDAYFHILRRLDNGPLNLTEG